MAQRIGKFKISKKDSALSLVDGGDIGGTLASTGAATFSSTVNATTGIQSAAVARTATADGTGLGTIADGTSFVAVTATDATHWVILPTPTPGNVVYLAEAGTTGFEIRSSAPGSVGINGGTGGTAESDIAGAITYAKLVCVTATSWICSQYDADGDESKCTVAA